MGPLAQGRSFGRFRLVEKLAVGGMAEIWSADDLEVGRAVALKLLLPQFVRDPHFRAMFADEVRICTQLTHPNIIEVFGAHEVDGYIFQAMELIDGLDLRRVLSRLAQAGHRFPVGIAMYCMRQVARGLTYAHEKRGLDGRPMQIVHRDVSPHNVMVSRTGQVKLLDFGIARAAERMIRTRAGVIKGKIAYMAPEQALALGVTPQSDIFAAGVVLWEMLAIRRLFMAENDIALVDQVVRAHVPSIRLLNPAVPPEVAELVEAMLQQRAPNRPASMRQVEQALTRALAHLPSLVSEATVATWMADVLKPPKGPVNDQDRTEPTAMDPDEAADRLADATQPDAAPPSEDVRVLEAPLASASADPSSVALQIVTPSRPKNGTPTDEDNSTDRVRLPTRSEIMAAVENQATQPVPTPGVDAPKDTAAEPKVTDTPPLEPPPHRSADPVPVTRSPVKTTKRLPSLPGPADESSWSATDLPSLERSEPPVRLTPGLSADMPRSGRLLPAVTLVLALLVIVLGVLLVLRD